MKKIVLFFLAVAVCAPVRAQPGVKALEIRAVMEKAADWQIANPADADEEPLARTAWLAGAMALDGVSASPKYREAVRAAGEKLGWKPGVRVYHADDYAAGQVFCAAYDQYREPKMLAALRERFDFIADHSATNPVSAGAVAADEVEGGLLRWGWSEALFAGPPAWMGLYAATGEKKYRDFAVKEWTAASDLLFDREDHLFFRDPSYFQDENKDHPKVFWSRGNGLAMAGLVRVLQCMKEDDPARKELEAQFKEMAAKVLEMQHTDGTWRPNVMAQTAVDLPEASGTGFFTFALAWGVNQGLLEREKFEPVVRKAWATLVAFVDKDGRVSNVQPAGKEPKEFNAANTGAYGTGALLLAGAEMFRLELLAAAPGSAEVRAASDLDHFRERETIELSWKDTGEKVHTSSQSELVIMDALTSRILDVQYVGGTPYTPPEKILFQSDFLPRQTKRFIVTSGIQRDVQPVPQLSASGRFVPENLDDFAWENDRVAFRMFGPAAAKEPGEPSGSGIDVWCKKVRSPVVDKWYKSGEYDKDTGEGLDFFAVGTARGCGGTGLLTDRGIAAASVFESWRIIEPGPIRFTVEFRFGAFPSYIRRHVETDPAKVLHVDDQTNEVKLAEFAARVKEEFAKEDEAVAAAPKYGESKTITIERGANFNRITTAFTAPSSDPITFVAGLSRTTGDEQVTRNEAEGWLAATSPDNKDNGRIHTALIAPRDTKAGFQDAVGHHLMIMDAGPGIEKSYFAGAGWSKGPDFPNHAAWRDAVKEYAARLSSPLRVEVK